MDNNMETIFYDNKLNKIHTKITNISINEGDETTLSVSGIALQSEITSTRVTP